MPKITLSPKQMEPSVIAAKVVQRLEPRIPQWIPRTAGVAALAWLASRGDAHGKSDATVLSMLSVMFLLAERMGTSIDQLERTITIARDLQPRVLDGAVQQKLQWSEQEKAALIEDELKRAHPGPVAPEVHARVVGLVHQNPQVDLRSIVRQVDTPKPELRQVELSV